MKAKKEIKLILLDREISVAALARRIHRSRTWTSQVLYGHEKSDTTRRAIAKALGCKVADLWPNNHREAA